MQLPRRVVVTGLGLISPLGNSVQESWSNCVEGRSGISKTTVDLEGMPIKVGGRIKNFDPTQYIDSKDVRRLDTFVQYGVSAGIQALEDAGIDDNINKDRVGLNIGSGIGGLDSIEKNKDITLLASSPVTKYQIFKYQNHAYGIQFHIEIKDTTVNEWGCVPEYKKALEDQLGDGALEKFDNAAKDNMSDMNNYSKILYENFKTIL